MAAELEIKCTHGEFDTRAGGDEKLKSYFAWPKYRANTMERKSDYFFDLYSQAKERYEAKIVSSGLRIDPYAIEDWNDASEKVPGVRWSDMMLYKVSTPRPYTREEIKVARRKTQACRVL